MQEESNSSSSCGMMNMEQFSSPAQIRSAVANLMSPPSYSSIFYQPFSSSSPATPPANSNSPGGNATSSSAAAISSLSRLMSEHQELRSLHAQCLTQLQRTFKEAETLRQENTNLRIANHDLNLHIQAALQNHYQKAMFHDTSDQYSSALPLSSSLSDRFGGLSIGENKRESGSWDEGFSTESPTSVIENNRSECQNVEAGRVTLPKSISIRSNAFLKMSQAATGATGSISGPSHGTSRIRAQNHVPGPQKVYVRGGSRKEGPIELEVYNQGMFKTELCNKWQETGACPYGHHCQFAHGIAELRPVIRHPRYKTEVCRMVLAGDPCPYGHRCHFRHALTEEEKLMIPLGQSHHPAPELG